MVNSIVTAAFIGLFVIGAAGSAPRGQATQTVWDGVYTEEQAKRGAVLFDRECAGCHGPSGAGRRPRVWTQIAARPSISIFAPASSSAFTSTSVIAG